MKIYLNDGTFFTIIRVKKDGVEEEKLRIEITDAELSDVIAAFAVQGNTQTMYLKDNTEKVCGIFVGYTKRISLLQDTYKYGNEEHERITLIYKLESTSEQINILSSNILSLQDENTSLKQEIVSLNQQLNPTIDYEIMDLDTCKEYKQNENNLALESFLSERTVEFNGKQYGVSYADQNEMMSNLMQYQLSCQVNVETAVLEWHAKKEKCEPFTLEDFTALALLIKEFVYPYVAHCQDIKELIYACTTKEELQDIQINYEDYAVNQGGLKCRKSVKYS